MAREVILRELEVEGRKVRLVDTDAPGGADYVYIEARSVPGGWYRASRTACRCKYFNIHAGKKLCPHMRLCRKYWGKWPEPVTNPLQMRLVGVPSEELDLDIEGVRWIELSDIFGRTTIPEAMAATVRQALTLMARRDDVPERMLWQALEYWAIDYINEGHRAGL